MEDDRAQVDLGLAADIEEKLREDAPQRQPKKRFVGRRQVTEAAGQTESSDAKVESKAIEGKILCKDRITTH